MRLYFRQNSGNALFLILIAVALFAAVSYALTQSGRGGGSTRTEQAVLDAGQILDYTATIQAAVTRLTAAGCSNTQLNFASSHWSVPESYDGIYHLNAPADHSCDIFDPAGAGVTWQAPPPGAKGLNSLASEYGITAILQVWDVGTETYSDPASTELTIIADVSKDVCTQLNNKLGIAAPIPTHLYANVQIPQMYLPGGPTGSQGFTFYGDYSAWNPVWTIGYNAVQSPQLAGQWAGCFQYNGGPPGQYTYYSVLVAR